MSKRIEKQAKASPGNIETQLLGGNLTNFYVATIWETVEDMKAFAHTGEHMKAIEESGNLSKEIRLIYYKVESNEVPTKSEIKEILETSKEVRVMNFD